jgi:hypothetical protein
MIVWSARILRNNMADQLVVGECNFFPVSSIPDTGLTPGLGNPMGGSSGGCNGTRACRIEHFHHGLKGFPHISTLGNVRRQ